MTLSTHAQRHFICNQVLGAFEAPQERKAILATAAALLCQSLLALPWCMVAVLAWALAGVLVREALFAHAHGHLVCHKSLVALDALEALEARLATATALVCPSLLALPWCVVVAGAV
jgi:hypothetical protein